MTASKKIGRRCWRRPAAGARVTSSTLEADALVLTILLYGSEVWCLREDLFAKLRTFHNSCCRAMCRITMAHTIRHHIPSKQLYKRLGIAAVDQYYHRRLLRWAGHVSRMPMSRAPQQLLTGWVANPRPIGSPLMTWYRT